MAESKIVERQKITINKVEYYLDTLDENSQKILGDIRVIDGEMQRLQVQMSIAGVAKNSLLEKIDEESEGFEQVPVDETDETDEKVAERTEETENERREPKGESWEDQ
jgi:hypothetical protein